MAGYIFILVLTGLFGIIMFLMFLHERKVKKESEILSKKHEERRQQVRTERAKRTYIKAAEEYKNKEAEPFLKFEAGEKVYFYKTINFLGQGQVEADDDKGNILLGSVILTDKQLIILNRDDICSYKTSELGYIGLHIKYIHISLPAKDIYFDLKMGDIARIERIAGKLNIKVKKVDELINPTPDPDFDKDIDNNIWY